MKESSEASKRYNVSKNKIKSIIEAQKLLFMTTLDKWKVKIYWGQLPSLAEVTQLGFSGYAITEDVENSSTPDLAGSDCTQVVIGPRSVIIWSAASESELKTKIKNTFSQVKWR